MKAQAQCTLDGVTYSIEIEKTSDETEIKFFSTNPPLGLDQLLYWFKGSLPEKKR